MSVHISNGIIKHNNELDVCFIKANKLFVIECKTGVTNESLFNEIVYKVCALKGIPPVAGQASRFLLSLLFKLLELVFVAYAQQEVKFRVAYTDGSFIVYSVSFLIQMGISVSERSAQTGEQANAQVVVSIEFYAPS